MTDLACNVCGAEFDLATAFASEADREALARLVAISIPIGARVLKYIGLHQPEKQRLTTAKKIKLLLQLLPDLEREGAAAHGGDAQTSPDQRDEQQIRAGALYAAPGRLPGLSAHQQPRAALLKEIRT